MIHSLACEAGKPSMPSGRSTPGVTVLNIEDHRFPSRSTILLIHDHEYRRSSMTSRLYAPMPLCPYAPTQSALQHAGATNASGALERDRGEPSTAIPRPPSRPGDSDGVNYLSCNHDDTQKKKKKKKYRAAAAGGSMNILAKIRRPEIFWQISTPPPR